MTRLPIAQLVGLRPRRGVRVSGVELSDGSERHVAVCGSCDWSCRPQVVKAAAEEEARWHRQSHRSPPPPDG